MSEGLEKAKIAALGYDEEDELADFKKEFYVESGCFYMDGNSLGLLSKRAERTLQEAIMDWKDYGIDGWTDGRAPWFYMAETLGKQMAPLVGAETDAVIVTGSTTGNLHQALATFYKPSGQRKKIVADRLTFPSDIYAIKSHLKMRGQNPDQDLVLVKSRDGRLLSEADIIEQMMDDVALVILPSVLYRSGQLLDVASLTAAAHERGILIGFDLCHSIGAVPHELDRDQVDFAFWCTYKYLNGGPGSVAGLYVNRNHWGLEPGLAGWFGSDKAKQFDMALSMTAANGAGAYQIGTPHVLSMAPLIGSLEMFQEAGIERIRKKSLGLTRFMMTLVQAELGDEGFIIGNPSHDNRRGGHVALEHPEAARICKALKANGVVPDFRAPNVIRLAPVALYTSYKDVWEVVRRLKRIMATKAYEAFENKREVIA
ncbi:kynureninase [Camelliibacillus cellulosilyticus]|uniref:Kynureninase n=1 Tax=Camelliibacillus cellulosilyticus TaxID=2174486 RepID=A0ABV9GN77_9BACL